MDNNENSFVLVPREPTERMRAEGGYKAHFERMQDMMRRYIEPITYVASFPADSTKHATEFEEPGPHDSSTNSEGKRRRMDRAFISDMIHMMDGPEQRALSASPEPVPATNQAREVEPEAVVRVAKALCSLTGSESCSLSWGDWVSDAKYVLAALATQPATPQEGARALFDHEMRCRGVTASWSDVDEDDRKGWQASANAVLAATPTPPTLSEDLRALVEQEAVDIITDLIGPDAAQSGTNCRVVEDHLKQFARNLARAQVKAS